MFTTSLGNHNTALFRRQPSRTSDLVSARDKLHYRRLSHQIDERRNGDATILHSLGALWDRCHA